MNTSTNENEIIDTAQEAGGAFADGLTLIRVLLTPVVMFVIIKMGWPDVMTAVLASALFIIAALTDILDDVMGGAKTSAHRRFGWFDDIADLVLIIGTLLALAYVINRAGLMGWAFAIPAGVLIGREVVIGLVKGYQFSKNGWPSTKWTWLKNALTFTAVCALLASPWLTGWYDSVTATDATLIETYGSNSAGVWIAAQVLLWVAAVFSVMTGLSLLRTSKDA